MILVSQIRVPLSGDSRDAVLQAKKRLHLSDEQVVRAQICRISVDARRRPPVLVYTVGFLLVDPKLELCLAARAGVQLAQQQPVLIAPITARPLHPPVVCGFGPAGLFAALLLARAGLCPVVVERGPDVDERMQAVAHFEKTGVLDENANIQFGEGGAGAFSDGKLTTRIKDPICAFVTKTLVEHGAPEEITMQQKPHVGTDLLCGVLRSIRKEILDKGGRIYFRTKMTGLLTRQDKLCGVRTEKGEIACEQLILALGHSARDTFLMLHEAGMSLMPKAFSVGVRAEHLQQRIEESLYHEAAGHPALPRGEYQLSQHIGGRCVYSFCMCPGGHVVAAASEAGRVVTNGMSYHARNGKNANAAVVVSVSPQDFGGDARQAIAFQQGLERRAYEAGGGAYGAPAESMDSFLCARGRLLIRDVQPTYTRGVCAADLGSLLPAELAQTLREGLRAFDRKLNGYASGDAVLTGLETRTSSPVRLLRSEKMESCDIKGVYPCGEGAGYAGGIMSAAADGVRVAQAVAAQIEHRCKRADAHR